MVGGEPMLHKEIISDDYLNEYFIIYVFVLFCFKDCILFCGNVAFAKKDPKSIKRGSKCVTTWEPF